MALYFAQVTIALGNLYNDMVVHYSKVPSNSTVPTLLSPIPSAVSWLRIQGTGVSILGTSETTPFYVNVQPLDTPVEFFGGGGRNTINLRGVYLTTGQVNIAFQVI